MGHELQEDVTQHETRLHGGFFFVLTATPPISIVDAPCDKEGSNVKSKTKTKKPPTPKVKPKTKTKPSAMPQEGARAPAFQLEDDAGKRVNLATLAGQAVVLYFYPKDNTSGCTRQACDFRDSHEQITAAGAIVIGVSPDSARSHTNFKQKFELPFALLVDAEHKLAETYGVWVEKSMYGRKYMGIQRATFLIDKHGGVVRVWPKVAVNGHVSEVVKAVKSL